MDGDILDSVPLRFLLGSTASGKTGLALRLARDPRILAQGGIEILSLDSMNVYRGLDIGTAKPSAEERASVPHHLIDVADPGERFDLQRYVALVRETLGGILERGAMPLFVGGTGLYLAALMRGVFEGPPGDLELRERIQRESDGGQEPPLHERLAAIDPESAARLHPNDVRRTLRALEVWYQRGVTMTALQHQWSAAGSERVERATLLGLSVETERLDELIKDRTRVMLESGWPAEAMALESRGGLGPSASQALGYDSALALAKGELTFQEALDRIALRTRQFARRQRTWYRKFPITWMDAEAPETLEVAVEQLQLVR